MTREDIVRVALECEGTPYRHQGRVIGVGMDCPAPYCHVCETLGIPYKDEMGYPRTPFDGRMVAILDAQPSLRVVNKSEMDAGDVLCMRIASAPQHMAIHLGKINGFDYILHGSSEHGKVAAHRLCDVWGARVVRVYRFEGIQ